MKGLQQKHLMHESLTELLRDLQTKVGKALITDWLNKNKITLSKRQMKEILSYSKKERNLVTIEEYKKKYKITYETVRTDLAELEVLGIFDKLKVSRMFMYKFDCYAFCDRIARKFKGESDLA